MNRFNRSARPPAPGGDDAGPLSGFDRMKANLDRVVGWAVAGRLRAGQGADAIRAEVPMSAARAAATRFPDFAAFEESTFAYAGERVEIELAKAGGDA